MFWSHRVSRDAGLIFTQSHGGTKGKVIRVGLLWRVADVGTLLQKPLCLRVSACLKIYIAHIFTQRHGAAEGESLNKGRFVRLLEFQQGIVLIVGAPTTLKLSVTFCLCVPNPFFRSPNKSFLPPLCLFLQIGDWKNGWPLFFRSLVAIFLKHLLCSG